MDEIKNRFMVALEAMKVQVDYLEDAIGRIDNCKDIPAKGYQVQRLNEAFQIAMHVNGKLKVCRHHLKKGLELLEEEKYHAAEED